MRPKGSAKELQVRRQIAGKLLKAGKGVREVAQLVEASPSSVSRWKKMLEEGGRRALKAKPHPGRTPGLSAEQKKELEKVLLAGPQAAGYGTDLWTLARIAQVIERMFGLKYHPGHVWYILRGMGWSCQKPERRARERDGKAIEAWRKQDWPRIKKSPPSRMAHRFDR